MKTRSLVLVLALLCFLFIAPARAAEPTRKTLLIGVDGMLAEMVRQGIDEGYLPTYRDLAQNGACVNYDMTSSRASNGKYNTISGANWTALFTGVEFDVHGVVNNAMHDKRSFDTYFVGFRHNSTLAADLARAGLKSAMFVEWIPLAQAFGHAFAKVYPEQLEVTDAVAKATEYLKTSDEAFTFVHIDIVDHAGHTKGFDPGLKEYKESGIESDKMIGGMLEALRSRAAIAQEQWLIIITTDHGGYETNHNQFDNPKVYKTFMVTAELDKGSWRKVDKDVYGKPATIAAVPGMIERFLLNK